MTKYLNYFFIMFLIQACSYEPIFSSKQYDFEFVSINYDGDTKINQIIKDKLKNNINGDKKYELYFKTNHERKIISSDSKGDPKIYKLELNLNYVVSENGRKVLEDKILKESTYNNINDKYELSKYEQNVLNNLSLIISNEILFSIKVLNK